MGARKTGGRKICFRELSLRGLMRMISNIGSIVRGGIYYNKLKVFLIILFLGTFTRNFRILALNNCRRNRIEVENRVCRVISRNNKKMLTNLIRLMNTRFPRTKKLFKELILCFVKFLQFVLQIETHNKKTIS